jgi:hypothetical protein
MIPPILETTINAGAVFGYVMGTVCGGNLGLRAWKLFHPIRGPVNEPFSGQEIKELSADIKTSIQNINSSLDRCSPT